MNKIVIFSAFLAIFMLFLKPPNDPDLFWHLRYGEEILKTHQIPYEDQFSFTMSGYQWADSYWLSEVLFYFLVSKTGFLFPALLFAFLGAVPFLAVGFGARLGQADSRLIAIASFLGAIVSYPILGFRPQAISIVLFGVVIIIIHQFWLNKRAKLIFLLPLIFLLWANLHAGFTLGLFLVWSFWGFELGRFFYAKLLKTEEITRPYLALSQLKLLFGLLFLSSLVTFCNPYGVGLWQTILNDATSSEIKKQIAEWMAPDLHGEFGLFFFFYLLVLVVLAYLGRIRIHPTRFLILLVFSFFALAAVRHIAILAMLATPFLAEELSVMPWKKINFRYKILALILFLLFFSFAWAVPIVPQTFQSTRNLKNLATDGGYPYDAVEYLKSHPQERILAEYGWGGYLIWQLPQSKTFIDGRMPGWKRGQKEILTDYVKVVDLQNEGPQLLDHWQVQAVLLPPDYPLNQYLKLHPNWEKNYEDKSAVIFTRR